jgi:hypothetical protein
MTEGLQTGMALALFVAIEAGDLPNRRNRNTNWPELTGNKRRI